MDEPKKTIHKKRRLNHHIAPHHKEPVAAITVAALLLALSALFAIGVIITKDFIRSATKPNETTSTPTAAHATSSTLSAIVKKTSYSLGDEAFRPGPNQQFAIVDVDVSQRLDKPMWLSPLLQSYILDEKGNHYTLSPTTLENPFDARSYNIDEHAMGQLSYLVPKSAKRLQWCYEISEQKLKVCNTIK